MSILPDLHYPRKVFSIPCGAREIPDHLIPVEGVVKVLPVAVHLKLQPHLPL
jgi:hypothetical protein